MADTVPVVKVADRLTSPETYKKLAIYVGIIIVVLLLIVGAVSLWRFIFVPPDKQTISSDVIVKPFAKVEKGGITQTNSQILVTEKPWEINLGVGVLRYDGKDGWVGGAVIKRKF